ncbi:hypothetical protein D9615_007341 [Tricholomella constricta]|uniref:Uncharacterized protein n=1 Tax=Tricholomella constricta TaxID=117010 RepID=A0A8H5M1A2_9AGAR|nr:hypothetical protein D9615_007341 [Tricholomella constricta]
MPQAYAVGDRTHHDSSSPLLLLLLLPEDTQALLPPVFTYTNAHAPNYSTYPHPGPLPPRPNSAPAQVHYSANANPDPNRQPRSQPPHAPAHAPAHIRVASRCTGLPTGMVGRRKARRICY